MFKHKNVQILKKCSNFKNVLNFLERKRKENEKPEGNSKKKKPHEKREKNPPTAALTCRSNVVPTWGGAEFHPTNRRSIGITLY
jgi:hypothetical protein